ncbi:hypothetical protein J6590_021330 [Homalodisca vitripennis]|nr:hypothetical protein J6590_021330 [Homalodisca vitripennis]
MYDVVRLVTLFLATEVTTMDTSRFEKHWCYRSIEYRLTSQTILGDFSRILSLIDWDSALSGLESEAIYDKFHDIFICWMNVHLPVKWKTFKPKPKRNSWYSPHLQLMKDRVMALLRRSRQSGQNADIETYKAAKRTYRQALQVARRESNEEFINTADNKCKAAWTIVNRETGRDRPSHHVQPDAEEFSKYCISAVDEIRQSLSLPSSSAVDLLQRSTPAAPSRLFNWRPDWW